MRVMNWLRLLVTAFMLGSVEQAVAGQFEDGVAAYQRGDYTAAFRLWMPLAEQGDAQAQANVASMYVDGSGVPQDYEKAVQWYHSSANQGNALAERNLGILLYSGNGVPRDYEEAAKWLRKAAEHGVDTAQAVLGTMYANGIGVSKNSNEAAKWYGKAADQGNVSAQDILGGMYVRGEGVAQNYLEAVRLFNLAANNGNIDAQCNLSSMYASGKGVEADYVTAYKWNIIALAKLDSGDKLFESAVGLRDTLSHIMTPRQIAQSQKQAAEWTSSLTKKSFAAVTGPIVSESPPKIRGTFPTEAQSSFLITAPSALAVTNGSVEVSGKIGGSPLTSLTVDGKAAPYKPDGSFKFRRAVPLGESVIRLVATNEWGQSAEATIKVTRTIATESEVAFAPLNPSRLHGKARPKAIALIIGIEQYKSIPPAEFAENDARSFYDYALNALGVPASRVKLLTGADAQRVDVEAAILTWLKPQVVKDQTEVFVFFSGHGLASDDGKDLYLLPQDGNRALLDRSALRRKELIDMIVDSGAKSATLFLDTCYSGGTRGKETLVSSARPILVAAKEQAVPPNVTILAAAGNDQLSSSLVSAKHGLFSYFLMKGLEGEAAGPDRTITAAKLEAYLAEKIPAEAAKLGRTQTPQLIGDGSRMVSSW